MRLIALTLFILTGCYSANNADDYGCSVGVDHGYDIGEFSALLCADFNDSPPEYGAAIETHDFAYDAGFDRCYVDGYAAGYDSIDTSGC